MRLKPKPDRYFIVLIGLLTGFILFQVPHLNLPYYWDEAWVYGRGIRLMCINGPGISPAALPVDISRGHPLFFYFAGGVWLKLFGNTILSSHLFALCISVILILSAYFLCVKFFGNRIAFLVSLFLMMQAIFLAQSVMVLPEVMLSMWVVLSVWAFYTGKKILYLIFAALMLLTKETGIVCVVAIGLNEFIFASEFLRDAKEMRMLEESGKSQGEKNMDNPMK